MDIINISGSIVFNQNTFTKRVLLSNKDIYALHLT